MNFKKKFVAIAAATACSLSAMSFGTVNQYDDSVNAATITGKTAFEITDQMTIGWNLGNSLDCSGTGSSFTTDPKFAVTKWGNPEPTQALFDAVKAAGFNTVRVPTTWYEHIQKDSNGDWEVSPDWMAYVKKTVDYAYDNDMFVILNVHHEDWVNVPKFTDETKAAAAEKLEDIWTQIAEEFKDYDQHLIFEGMNEPRQVHDPKNPDSVPADVEWGAGDTYSWQYVNDLNAIFVDVVRSQGSSANNERVLMLPGYVASSNPDTIKQIAIPEGSGNIALSVHAYLPYFFTMATDSYANHEYKADGSSASGWGANYRQEINTFFSNMKSIISQKNAPIIIGEFSASDFGNTDSRINWAKDYLGAAKDAGIPCVLWDNNAVYSEGATPSGENHGYINRKNNLWYENSAPVIETMMQTLGVTNYSIPVYEVKDFSWNDMKIGSDWVELFKSTDGQMTLGEGDAPYEWGNVDIPGFKNYLNENYNFVMFAKSDKAPAIVPMTSNSDGTEIGWNVIANDGTSTQDYVYKYSFSDIKSYFDSNGLSIDTVSNLFASAQGSIVTVYGFYAVPANSTVEPTEPTTTVPVVTTTKITTTKTTTTKTTTTSNSDGSVKVEADISEAVGGYAFDLGTGNRIGNTIYVELEAASNVSNANGCVGVSVTYEGTSYWVAYKWEITKSGANTVKLDINNPFEISYNDGEEKVTDKELINQIVGEVYSKSNGMVQVWWTNTTETSDVTVKGVYVIETPVETTTAPVVTTTVTTTAEPATDDVTEEFGKASLVGDVDCDNELGTSDIVTLAKYIASKANFPLKDSVATANADVNYDKKIDSTDTLKLIEFHLRKIPKL